MNPPTRPQGIAVAALTVGALALAGCGGASTPTAATVAAASSAGSSSASTSSAATVAPPTGPAPSGTAHATASGAGGGTFTGGTCTTAGGNLYLSIGRASQGRYFSIVVPAPSAPGAVPGGLIQWGDSTTPFAIGATTSSITFDAGLRSGSFSGTAIDPSHGSSAPGSGSFSCD